MLDVRGHAQHCGPLSLHRARPPRKHAASSRRCQRARRWCDACLRSPASCFVSASVCFSWRQVTWLRPASVLKRRHRRMCIPLVRCNERLCVLCRNRQPRSGEVVVWCVSACLLIGPRASRFAVTTVVVHAMARARRLCVGCPPRRARRSAAHGSPPSPPLRPRRRHHQGLVLAAHRLRPRCSAP